MHLSRHFDSLILVTCALISSVFGTDTIIVNLSKSLTDDNWEMILTGEWIVEFKAPWCPACQNFEAIWEQLAAMRQEFDIDVADIDVTKNPVLSGRFFVTSLPTIYHVKDGVFRQYVGARDQHNLVELLSHKLWQDIKPVEWWFNPTYPHMAFVGCMFKMSMFVREFYNMLVNDFGIPEWLCYVVFAVSVIIVGILLGLLCVLCCDYMFPPRRSAPPPVIPPNESSDGDDIIDDSKIGDGDGSSSLRRRVPDTTTPTS